MHKNEENKGINSNHCCIIILTVQLFLQFVYLTADNRDATCRHYHGLKGLAEIPVANKRNGHGLFMQTQTCDSSFIKLNRRFDAYNRY